MNGKWIRRWLLSWLEQSLLRRAPQADPVSATAMGWSLLAYVALDLLQARASSDWQTSLAMTALDTLIMVLFSWSVLRLTKKSARYMQTLTALAGTGAVLGLVGLPLIQQAAQAHLDEGPAGTLVLGWLILLVWSISVQAHIYRHALSTRYGAGLLVAGLQMVLVISLLETLFPRTAG
ncbi:MAG: hypothetical protein BMS9Abin08_1143 [Gammaproteobacteria bacterium]|nr:MAG: hypothetical protein BMS9Abin08_1143 [Gammaproteobacteria bacterium]